MKWLLTPPTFGDAEKSRRAELIHITSILLFCFCFLLYGLNLLFGLDIEKSVNWLLAMIALLQIFIQWIIRKGYVYQASIIVLTISWGALTEILRSVGGVRDVAILGYVLILLASGYLLGWRISALYTFASIVAIWLIAWLEVSAKIIPAFGNPYRIALDLNVIFILIFLVGYFLVSSLTKTIRRSQEALTDRLRVEETLAREQERLQLALQASNMGTWDWEINSGIVIWSDDVASLFGLQPDQFDGKYETYLSFIHPDDLPVLQEAIAEALYGNTPEYRVVHRVIWPDGETHWLEGSGKVYPDSEGKPIRMAGTVVDITKRWNAESERDQLIQELQQKNIHAETLRETSMVVASTLDQTEAVDRILVQLKRVVHYDSASVWLYKGKIANMIGWNNLPQDAVGPGYYTLSEKEPDHPLTIDNNLDFILHKNIQENYPKFKQPSLSYIKSWMAIPLRVGGKMIGFIALDGHKPDMFSNNDAQLGLTFANQVSIALQNAQLVSDLKNELNERIQAERDLKSSEEKFSKVFHTTQVLLTIENEKNQIIDVNNAFLEVFGLQRDQVLGKRISDLNIVYSEDDLVTLHKAYKAQGYLNNFETRFQSKAGKIGYALLSSDTFKVGGKNYLLTSGLDITEKKKSDHDREKLITELQAKNSELERFTYTVSHDLKSPLITISGFLGYLEEDAKSGNIEQLNKDIQRIQNAVKKMQDLLNELLELSRIGRIVNEPELINMNELVGDILKLVQGPLENKQVSVQTHPNLPAVFGDRSRLGEVFQNLIENAIKYFGDQPEPQIEIGSTRKNSEYSFFVRDNGIGIAPQFHEKIFGLFEQLDPNFEGTGVGLALVKRIVEFHGGKTWVESELGEGSTFVFTLPKQLDDM